MKRSLPSCREKIADALQNKFLTSTTVSHTLDLEISASSVTRIFFKGADNADFLPRDHVEYDRLMRRSMIRSSNSKSGKCSEFVGSHSLMPKISKLRLTCLPTYREGIFYSSESFGRAFCSNTVTNSQSVVSSEDAFFSENFSYFKRMPP